MIDGDDVFEPIAIAHRDPIPKTMVAKFATSYPDLSDDELFERMRRAWRSLAGDAEFPMTVQEVAHWRSEAVR